MPKKSTPRTKPLHALIYVRSARRPETGHECDLSTYPLPQVILCRDYAEQHGYVFDGPRIVYDFRPSTGYAESLAMEILRNAVTDREIDVVLVTSLDRISRDLAEVAAFQLHCAAAGVVVEGPHVEIPTAVFTAVAKAVRDAQ